MESSKELESVSANFPYLSTCDYCNGLPQNSHRFLRDLKHGLANGCGLCTVLLRGISGIEKTLKYSHLANFRALNVVSFLGIEQHLDACTIVLDEEPGQQSRLVLQLFRHTSQDVPDALVKDGRLTLPRDVPTKLEVPRLVTLTKQWLEDCEQNHLRCRLTEYTPLPRRVLDVPSREGGNIKLVELRGVAAPYIALSYCWGSSGTNLKTTSTTISQHLRDIPWDSLPRCFQDALVVCQALQVRYLWIDALCIIQDSTEDWEIESANMAAVYSNAFLTISASSLSDPSASLFSDRWTCAHASIDHDKFLQFPSGTGYEMVEYQGQFYRFRRQIETAHLRLTYNSMPLSPYPDAPLFTRGWVFQERMLSPRTLHFHSEEVVWECKTSIRCECGVIDDDSTFPVQQRFLQRVKSSISMVGVPGTSHDALSDAWMELVSKYSQLDLSYESDRLPALSGLAALFSNTSFGHYFAGMWVGMLPAGLLYAGHSFSTTPVAGLQAPSWSWASLPIAGLGSIQYGGAKSNYFREKCPEFTVLSVKSKVLGKNPFGWVKYARLSIRAKCTECFIHMAKTSPFGLETPFISLTKSRVAGQVPDYAENFLLDPPVRTIEHNTKALFLYVGSNQGLVLQKMGPLAQNSVAYRRLGLLSRLQNFEAWNNHLKVRDLNLE